MRAVAVMNSGAEGVSGVCAATVEARGSDHDASAVVSLELPAPPSVNALFKNIPGKGRVRTKMYDEWLAHAGWRLRKQCPAHLDCPVIVIIEIERTNSMADIDNRIKPTLDLLVSHKVIKDDRFVVGVAAAWQPPRNGLLRLAVIPAADITLKFQLASSGAEGGWLVVVPSEEEDNS